MDDDRSKDVWPLPKFCFRVTWDGVEANFQEVVGLDEEAETLEYRTGSTPGVTPIKMPGLVKSYNVTLKQGVFTTGPSVFDWIKQIKMNTIQRRQVTISLVDETGAPTMVWILRNAFPVKVTGPDPAAEGAEMAVESLEIAHEGVVIENG